jgi:hypothetical protein
VSTAFHPVGFLSSSNCAGYPLGVLSSSNCAGSVPAGLDCVKQSAARHVTSRAASTCIQRTHELVIYTLKVRQVMHQIQMTVAAVGNNRTCNCRCRWAPAVGQPQGSHHQCFKTYLLSDEYTPSPTHHKLQEKACVIIDPHCPGPQC